MSDELKPCPFCGGDPIHRSRKLCMEAGGRVAMACGVCLASIPVADFDQAVAAWNRRATPDADEATSRLRDGVHHAASRIIDLLIDERGRKVEAAYEEAVALLRATIEDLASTQPAAPTAAEEPWQDMLERGESLVREALKRAGEAR